MTHTRNRQEVRPEKEGGEDRTSLKWRNLVDVIFVWDMIWVIIAAAIGIGALAFAVFTLNGAAFAIALIAIPGAFIAGCMVVSTRDVGRDV